MTRKAHSRFAQYAAAQKAAGQTHPRPTTGQLRDAERARVQQFNDNFVGLPNPDVAAPFDRHAPQAYQNKVVALGLAPNLPRHFYELDRGDAGASSSIYRRTTIFHLLGATGDRVVETPYSKAIEMATMRSSDQRPRYFQVSLFSVGLVLPVPVPTTPFPSNDLILNFASGATLDNQPTAVPSVVPSFGVPFSATVKFRMLVEDESGGRFVDVDVIGTRSMKIFAFAVTVFVLIKEDGYEVDKQQIASDPSSAIPLGPGLIEQAVVGSRIIGLRTNETKNVNNRTVGVNHPGGAASRNIIIPSGALRVQLFTDAVGGPPAGYTFSFRTSNQLAAVEGGVVTVTGVIDFEPGESRTTIYDIPNSNVIRIDSGAGSPAAIFNAVFEVTS